MTHEPTIRHLHGVFRLGSVTTQKDERKGNEHYRRRYLWCVASRQAGVILEAVHPYLVTKTHEADLALEFLAIPLPPRGGGGGNKRLPESVLAERHRLYIALKEAKHG